jgi:hypothetical protein
MDKVMWNPETASLTQLYAATSPEIVEKRITGQYLVPVARICEPSDVAKNLTLQQALWDTTEELIREKLQNREWPL